MALLYPLALVGELIDVNYFALKNFHAGFAQWWMKEEPNV